MKSIHNSHANLEFMLVNPHVKIQFEINSQQICKDYIQLVNPHVKIQFEINSQRKSMLSIHSCESSRKNTI